MTCLLEPGPAPLQTLRLWRIQLDKTTPYVSVSAFGLEGVLYSLIGQVDLYVDGERIGGLGGRERLAEEQVHCLRLQQCGALGLTLRTVAADLLWMTTEAAGAATYLYRHDEANWHTVGDGTHQRRVAEVPTPSWAQLACGETHNIPGGISSWPPHASKDDIERFSNKETTWQEVMWFACAAPGIANLQGVYTGGIVVNKLVPLYNGTAHVMPLGSHPIHAGPGATMYYVWCYAGTALQKQYNQAADDTGTYRK